MASRSWSIRECASGPAAKFAPDLIECVRFGAEKADFKSREIISGAGHEAAYIAGVAPTTMIFVPCAGAQRR
jgi:N-carbamoyl-L-amino-acid hydrolase